MAKQPASTISTNLRKTPKLCRHKSQRRGYVTWQGVEHYFPGSWPDGQAKAPPEIWGAYQAFLGQIFSGQAPSFEVPKRITVAEICVRFLRHAQAELPHQEFLCFRGAIRPLIRKFGGAPAEDLGPWQFKELRDFIVVMPIVTRRMEGGTWQIIEGKRTRVGAKEVVTERPRTRTGVNICLRRIRSVWKWAVLYHLIPPSCLEGAKTVFSLRKGRVEPEKEILPVSDEDVRRTIEVLHPILGAMVKLQRLTAMRPGELVRITMGEIDRSDRNCWWYRPGQHKNAWRGHGRSIPLGPQAQGILLPYLKADPARPLFSPAERVEQMRQAQREKRKTPVQPSQVDRGKLDPKRKPGKAYTTQTYDRAIRRACLKAGVVVWNPNQLRKAAADEILNTVDLETASAFLGHNHPEVTKRRYAVRDVTKARVAAGAIVGV